MVYSYAKVISKRSYESHTVITEDGYSLTLLRLPAYGETKDATNGVQKPPVLVVHGLISCGTHWFMNTPQKDLPHKLSTEGYDVWIVNLRGTPLSRSHVKVPAESTQFWDFSWHEMGQYDIPAIFNFVLSQTGSKQLAYVGHSMGCAVFFAAMALHPELNEKVHCMVALAPSVYGRYIRNRLAKLSVPVGTFLGRLKTVYSREIFPMTLIAYAKKILPYLTLNPERVGSWILRTFGTQTGVLGAHQIEKHRMIHIAGRFQQYDYGKIGNFTRYGEPQPPLYELHKTTCRVATFYSTGDELCTKNDVTLLANELPNLIGNFGVQHRQFAHTDFMFGKDADRLVYGTLLDILS